MKKINIREKLAKVDDRKVDDRWHPRIIAQFSGIHVKVSVKGEFEWHYHEEEDELFWIHKGADAAVPWSGGLGGRGRAGRRGQKI